MEGYSPVRIALALMLLACTSASVQAGYSSLVRNSPFLPPQFNPPGDTGEALAVPASGSRFEFHGVYQLNGQFYYHIFDQGSLRGEWIRADDRAPGKPHIVEYRQDSDLIVIEMSSQQFELPLLSQGDQEADEGRRSRTSLSGQDTGPAMQGLADRAHIRRPVIRSTGGEVPAEPVRRVTFSEPPTSN